MRILRRADRQGTPDGVSAGDPVRGVQAAAGTPLNGADPETEIVADAPGQIRPPGRPRRIGLLIGMAAFVIAADAISKAIVVA
jgi:hypothetical protein